MKDLIPNILRNLSERAQSPLFGSFFISLGLLYWRSLIYLFTSEASIEVRLDKLTDYQLAPWWWAAIFALVYMICSPWVHLGLDKVTVFAKDRRVEGLIRSRTAREKSRAELVRQEARNEEIRSNLGDLEERAKVIEERNAEIENLKALNTKQQVLISDNDERISKLTQEHSELTAEYNDHRMRYSTNSKLMAEIVSETASIEQQVKMMYDDFASLDHPALTVKNRDYIMNMRKQVKRLRLQLARLKSNSYKMQSNEENAQTHYDNDTKRMRRSIEKINKASKK